MLLLQNLHPHPIGWWQPLYESSCKQFYICTGQLQGVEVCSASSDNLWAFISLEMSVTQLRKQEHTEFCSTLREIFTFGIRA